MAKKTKNGLKVAVGSLQIGPYAKKLIKETLDKNRLTYGDITIEFENKFAAAHGARYGLFTVSGTCALQIALHAMKSIHGWKDGDEVIVPALTFIATSNIVMQNNMKPIFVDIDPRTYNIDPKKIEAAITKRTRAIIPVHLFSQPADMEKIMPIARRRGLKVIADSCETMGVGYQGKPLAAWGDIVCFSTYAAHLLVTGVGGLALTNNPEYATAMRSLMNHGRDTIYYHIDQDDKITNKKKLFKMVDRRFSFIDVGYSYRLTEMEAAVGLEGLRNLKSQLAKRKAHYKFLVDRLSKFSKDITMPFVKNWEEHAYMMVPLVVTSESKVKRDDLIEFLESRGIETRYAMPLLNQPVYKKLFGNTFEDRYPVAKWVAHYGFYIGCHPYLTKKDLQYAVSVFEEFFAKNK